MGLIDLEITENRLAPNFAHVMLKTLRVFIVSFTTTIG